MLEGPVFGEDNSKVHLDGYSHFRQFKGETDVPARKEFFYFSDGGDLMNLRYNQYKIVFAEQRAHGIHVWEEQLSELRFPKIFNLRADPFEIGDQIGEGYQRWTVERMFVMQPTMAFIQQLIGTFEEYPPRQSPDSWTLGDVMQTILDNASR